MVNLCAFYTTTFGNICGFASPLSKCCDALKLNATKELQASITASINDTRGNGRPTQGAILEALRAVTEVATLHKNSALSESFDIGSLIDSYAVGLRASIADCGGAPVFQMNALFELLTVCRDGNVGCRGAVADDVEALFRRIVNGEVDEIYRRCRIGEVLVLIEAAKGQPMSIVRGLEPDLMRAAVKRFETVLVGSGPIVAPLADTLQSPELRQRARKEIAERLAETYEMMFNVVTDPTNGYDATGTVFKHTPALLRDMMMV
jgi:hypothetical protein